MDYNYYHRLLRNGADLSVLDEQNSLTRDELVRLIQDYIKYEKIIIGDPARKIVAINIAIAKQSNQRIRDANQYLSNLTNHETIRNQPRDGKPYQ